MQPTVSVILTFQDSNEEVRNAIDSILSQTFSKLELILVSNSPDNGSQELASEFIAADKRIKLVEEPSQNYVKALNKGIEVAGGNYLFFMSNTDTAEAELLEKQVNFLENNKDIGLVGCLISPVYIDKSDEDNEYIDQYVNWSNRIITHEDISVNRFIESPVVHSTILYRKEIFKKYGLYLNVDAPTDFEFLLRLLEAGVKMHKLPEILFNWTFYPEKISVVDSRTTDQGYFELKSSYLINWLKEKNQFFPDVVVWGAGRVSRQRFYILHELGIQPKFFIDLRANPAKSVIQYQHTPPAGRHFIISYVSNRHAREKIRMFLVELGYAEGQDFICIA